MKFLVVDDCNQDYLDFKKDLRQRTVSYSFFLLVAFQQFDHKKIVFSCEQQGMVAPLLLRLDQKDTKLCWSINVIQSAVSPPIVSPSGW